MNHERTDASEATPATPLGAYTGTTPDLGLADVEATLSSLAEHDITEHVGIYERLLTGLQHELHRTEHGA